MPWKIELADSAVRQLEKLDKTIVKRIRNLLSRIETLDNPRSIGHALQGERFGELWRYRVGEYRLICKIEDDRVVVLVLRVGHRRDVYR